MTHAIPTRRSSDLLVGRPGFPHIDPKLVRLRDGEPEVAGDDHHADLVEGVVQLGNGLGLLSTIHAILHVWASRKRPGYTPGEGEPAPGLSLRWGRVPRDSGGSMRNCDRTEIHFPVSAGD